MVDVQTTLVIRRLRILWWGSLGSILIYSTVIFFFGSFLLGDESDIVWDNNGMSIFLLTLLLSTLPFVLSFTLLGRNRFLKANNTKILLRLAVMRLASAEIPVILGIFVFVTIHSYVIYVPFFILSMLSLLQLKGEEKFYFVILNNMQ